MELLGPEKPTPFEPQRFARYIGPYNTRLKKDGFYELLYQFNWETRTYEVVVNCAAESHYEVVYPQFFQSVTPLPHGVDPIYASKKPGYGDYMGKHFVKPTNRKGVLIVSVPLNQFHRVGYNPDLFPHDLYEVGFRQYGVWDKPDEEAAKEIKLYMATEPYLERCNPPMFRTMEITIEQCPHNDVRGLRKEGFSYYKPQLRHGYWYVDVPVNILQPTENDILEIDFSYPSLGGPDVFIRYARQPAVETCGEQDKCFDSGVVYQYVGVTTNEYTHGRYYTHWITIPEDSDPNWRITRFPYDPTNDSNNPLPLPPLPKPKFRYNIYEGKIPPADESLMWILLMEDSTGDGALLTLHKGGYGLSNEVINGLMLENTGFVELKVNNLTATYMNFRNCTFLESTFTDCDFSYSAFSRCRFAECKFIRCKFDNCLIAADQLDRNCEWTDCSFKNVDTTIPQALTHHAFMDFDCNRTEVIMHTTTV